VSGPEACQGVERASRRYSSWIRRPCNSCTGRALCPMFEMNCAIC
jgi:hypothetical protein